MPVVINGMIVAALLNLCGKFRQNAELIKIEKIEQTTDIKGKVEIL